MPVSIQGNVYYRTTEACRKIGISRATFYRWLEQGFIEDVPNKDRNGWRLFTERDIKTIKTKTDRVSQK